MAKVLVSDPIADKGIELLEDAGFDIIYNPNPSYEELQALVSDVDGWVVRSGTKITSELLKDARNLKVIGRAGVGVDNIDILTFFGEKWRKQNLNSDPGGGRLVVGQLLLS